jgi:gamma-glutamyl-gamma-aminobutyrate hydrolase PuuD
MLFRRPTSRCWASAAGLQLINVAFGGTLYQDISTQHPGALTHRDGQVYDNACSTRWNMVPGIPPERSC